MKSTTSTPTRPAEQGWVLLASLILAGVAASVTVTWARHAVLAKGVLEMAHGASSSEEAARSGLNHCREQMRQGHPPGCTCDGTEDVVVTDDGNVVTIEREVESHDRRRIITHAEKVGGGFEEQAKIKGRATVKPASNGSGDPTRLDCDEGNGILMAGNLTIISGTSSYQNQEMAGLFLLEPGSELTLENIVLRGTIITRAGLCGDQAIQQGANRPKLIIEGGLRLLSGTVLPDVAMVGPDLEVDAATDSRVEIRGQVVADEVRIRGRGSVKGMVTTETYSEFGSNVRRPGHGRGTQPWSDKLVAGAEEITAISFPADEYTDAEMDLMESPSVYP
jgi:hypothetical protein